MNWDEYFMRHAYLVASKSKDQSTKIGAVNVIDNQILTSGYNGICRGVNDDVPERHQSPEKYFWFEHAERNSCYAAAREGIKIKGATMYTQDTPCADCCRSAIQSGIVKIVIHKQWSDIWKEILGNQWVDSQRKSDIMLAESGVEVVVFDQELGLETLMKGKIYRI